MHVDQTRDDDDHKDFMLDTDVCLLYVNSNLKDCKDERGTEWANDSEADVRDTECRWNE